MIRNARGEAFEISDLPAGYMHRTPNRMFPKLGRALADKTIGDRVEVTLTPADGFGKPDPELQFTDDIGNVPPELPGTGMLKWYLP